LNGETHGLRFFHLPQQISKVSCVSVELAEHEKSEPVDHNPSDSLTMSHEGNGSLIVEGKAVHGETDTEKESGDCPAKSRVFLLNFPQIKVHLVWFLSRFSTFAISTAHFHLRVFA
jgi:hypothetical protein